MPPASLADFHGQAHLLGPGQPLRRALDEGALHSMVLWGPPGTGKTSLCKALAQKLAIRLSDRILVMTGRPGRILEEVPIPLDRQRELARRKPAAVGEIKWHIWGLLEEQVRKSLWVAD